MYTRLVKLWTALGCLAVLAAFSATTELSAQTTASGNLPQPLSDQEKTAEIVQSSHVVSSSKTWHSGNDCCNPGTLFQWSAAPTYGGGPDLTEPLVTDRPDFIEAPSTVGLGVAQIEFGYTFGLDEDGPVRVESHSLGEPLLRYGIYADWLELRIGLAPVSETVEVGNVSRTTSGTEDLNLGLKIALTPQAGLLPEMAVIPQMNVPTGSSAFSSDSVEPGLIWIYGWEINDFLSTAGQTQANRRIDGGSGEAYVEISQAWGFAYSLTDKVGAYTEWFAFFPNGADTERTQHFADGGFTYLINNDLQFDIRAGLGLNDAAEDFFAGVGLSVRFP